MDGRFVSYLRVSTDRQGKSGLGLEAQRDAVARFLDGGAWTLAGEFVEVETGKNNDRPELGKALERCRLTGATLVVAKLDRLARNARFLLSVVEGSGEGGVVFCDLPQLPPGPVGKFMVTQMAAVAELEAGLISQRTKAALAQAKARGTILGGWRGGAIVDHQQGTAALREAADHFASRVGPTIAELRQAGLSLAKIAAKLEEDGIRTARGGRWTPTAVSNVLHRVDRAAA
jgi:DNA invertase Pin-like site-specific DNA recombinase